VRKRELEGFSKQVGRSIKKKKKKQTKGVRGKKRSISFRGGGEEKPGKSRQGTIDSADLKNGPEGLKKKKNHGVHCPKGSARGDTGETGREVFWGQKENRPKNKKEPERKVF